MENIYSAGEIFLPVPLVEKGWRLRLEASKDF